MTPAHSTTAARVVRASQLLDSAILSGLRSAFETPFKDEMTDFLVTLTTDDHLDLLCAVLLNCWAKGHPTHLAFDDWRTRIANERLARDALLAELGDAEPTAGQLQALEDDLERLAAHHEEALAWTRRLGNAAFPSVPAHLRALSSVNKSRPRVDYSAFPELADH